MLVRDWMTKEVVSITPETSLMKASRLMKERRVGRLPVVDDDGRVVGIVSDRDVKSASPSKATTLDMHELYYLLSELKVKEIMTKNPVCAKETDSVEGIALDMAEKRFGGMPVVDAAGMLRGIITDSDIFKVLVEITGVAKGGIQLAFEIENGKGKLRAILDTLRSLGARVLSVYTSQQEDDAPTHKVYIRLRPLDADVEARVVEEIGRQYSLLYWEPQLRRS